MPTPIEALRGVANANQALPHVITGGQPTPDHFRALRDAGVKVVLDIRDPMEPRGFDEPALLSELGLEYLNIVVSDGNLTDGTADRILKAMRENGNEPILVHCASGNRVGGALIPYLMIDHGFNEDEATMAAMRMGLRGAHLLEWGMAYARSKSGPSS